MSGRAIGQAWWWAWCQPTEDRTTLVCRRGGVLRDVAGSVLVNGVPGVGSGEAVGQATGRPVLETMVMCDRFEKNRDDGTPQADDRRAGDGHAWANVFRQNSDDPIMM